MTPIPEWTFGDRLRKAREDARILQEDMAKRFNVSPATISNWETGARLPRGGEVELAKRWGEITKVPWSWLLGVES